MYTTVPLENKALEDTFCWLILLNHNNTVIGYNKWNKSPMKIIS